MTLAESNKMHFDAAVDVITTAWEKNGEQTASMDITGLWSRLLYSSNHSQLTTLIEMLSDNYPFTYDDVFVNNGYAFEVLLPKIIVD